MAAPGRKATHSCQKTKIFHFFEAGKSRSEANVYAKGIINDIIERCNVVQWLCEEILSNLINEVYAHMTKRKRHTRDHVSKRTMDDWKRKYPWLLYNEIDNDLYLKCDSCIKMKSSMKITSVWAFSGTTNIQISSITRHNDSTEHKQATQQLAYINTQDELEENTSTSEHISSDDRILFNTVFYCAKSDTPSVKVNELLDLQRQNGLDIQYRHLSWDTVSDVQVSIAKVLTSTLVEEIKASSVFALMLDESTDITVDKRLSICVRYVKDGEAVTRFLLNTHLDDGCAITVVNCVVSEFEKFGIDLSKCTALATDGAAVMVGKHTGVGTQMKAKYSPFCTQTHCVAHRLNLACVDSLKKIDYLVKLRDKFTSLYLFINGSSKRTQALKQLQVLFEEPELSVKEPFSIRWLGLKSAVEAVYQCYTSILATLSQFAEDKIPAAKGLHKYFNNYKVVLTVAFMLDVHSELSVLSCELQKQNILFSELKPLLDGIISKLECMQSSDGQALANVKTNIIKEEVDGELIVKYCGEKVAYKKTMDAEFTNLRKEYLKKLCKNIGERFKERDMEMFQDFSKVLEPVTVTATAAEECADALAHLAEVYGTEKEVRVVEGSMIDGFEEHVQAINPLLDRIKLLDEWPRLHSMIKGAYGKLTISQLCKRIICVHNVLLPNCAILARIGLCLVVSSVECERSFSAQNRLKCKFRSSLASKTLDVLLKIKMLGPNVQQFNCTQAVQHWHRSKKRRKVRLYSEFKPRPAKVKKVN